MVYVSKDAFFWFGVEVAGYLEEVSTRRKYKHNVHLFNVFSAKE